MAHREIVKVNWELCLCHTISDWWRMEFKKITFGQGPTDSKCWTDNGDGDGGDSGDDGDDGVDGDDDGDDGVDGGGDDNDDNGVEAPNVWILSMSWSFHKFYPFECSPSPFTCERTGSEKISIS